MIACATAGCDPPRGSGSADAAAEAGPDAAVAPPPASSASAGPDSTTPLELLRLTLASGVEAKEPVDVLTKARPGQRVWAHVKLRNRSGRTKSVRLVFSVGGKERSRTDLDVEPSWSFRTWGYVTLQPGDRSGELAVSVLDDTGWALGESRLPIR